MILRIRSQGFVNTIDQKRVFFSSKADDENDSGANELMEFPHPLGFFAIVWSSMEGTQ